MTEHHIFMNHFKGRQTTGCGLNPIGLSTVGCDKEELVTCIECHAILMQMYEEKERDKGNPPPKVAIRQPKTAVLVPDPEWFQVDDRGNYTLKPPTH